MEYLLSVRFTFLIAVIRSTSAQYDCPSPWLTSADKCYKFELEPATLDDASRICEENGADLVSVNSRQEHEFIANWLSTNAKMKSDWYTSGRLEVHTPDSIRYRWDGDGTQLEGHEFWQPNGKTRKGDRILYNNNGNAWRWILGYGSAKRPFICEISRGDTFRIVDEERSFSYGIDEISTGLLEKGPKIEVQPKNVIYIPGTVNKIVTFPCQATGNPFPSYEWRKFLDGRWQKINPMGNTSFTITGGSLVITDPQDTVDNGDYQCKSSNKFGSVLSNQVQLNFGYLNDFPKSVRETVSVREFMYTGLECNPPKHYPDILYAWYKDDISNFVRPEKKPHTFISRDGKLYFSSVTGDDDGDYYCLVQNAQATVTQSAGKTSMPVPLKVTEGAASIREPKIVNGFPQVFPSAPKHGDTVTMECIAWGTFTHGDLEYSWSKKNGQIPAGAKFENLNRVLKIPSVEIAHEGEYECVVKRRNGQSDSKSLILNIEAAPFFIIQLKDQHVDIDSDVRLRCLANGKPQVTYQWYINSTLYTADNIPEKEKDKITIDQNVMQIKGVTEKYRGMYQCAAKNRLGTRFSSAQLRVISLAPTFVKYPVQPKVYATIGGDVTMRCRPEAAPHPKKEWKKNGVTLQPSTDPKSQAHQILLSNGNLLITKLTMADEGTYECTATNKFGSASSEGKLILLRESSVPYKPEDTTVSVNKTAFLHCEASYDRKLDLTYNWIHNGRPVIFERFETYSDQIIVVPDPHFARGKGIYRGGLYIYRVQFMHAGVYQCVAETTNSRVYSEEAELTVKGPPSPPGGVYGEGVGVHTITLFWTSGLDHGGEIRSYQIEGYSAHSKRWEVLKTDVPHDITAERRTNALRNVQKAKVDTLSPWTTYNFRVRARNDYGLGEPSMPSVATYTTEEAVPEQAPGNVGGGGGKVGDLVITWDPLPAEFHNGPGIGYRVFWKKKRLTDEDFDSKELDGPDHNKYVVLVGSNNFYSEYDVQVQIYNNQGDGPKSDIVTIMSAEDLPTATPLQIRADRHNATAIRVEWDPVPQTREAIKGILRGYRINYWKQEGEEEAMAFYNIVPWDTDNGLIIGLDPKTYYFINVQVYNHAGFGPKSSMTILEETYRLPPQEAPQEVHVFPVDYYTVKVEFRGVSTTIEEEPLQGYMVRWWPEGENLYVAQEIDVQKKTHLELGGLQSNQLYNLRVFGYSLGGEGKMSSPTVQFILGSDCVAKKEYPDKTYIFKCGSSCVHISSLLLLITLTVHALFEH